MAILFLLLVVLFTIILFLSGKANYPEENLITREEKPREIFPDTHKLFFVGDIMLDRGVDYMVRVKGGNDWTFPLSPVSDYLKSSDILFGNLESVISDKGYDIGGPYSFRADPQSIELLLDAEFSVLSVANNHSFDYTAEALTDSISRIQEAGIKHVGGGSTKEEAHSPALINLDDGTVVGFLAYTSVGSSLWQATETFSGIAWIDEHRLDTMEEDIMRAKESADIIVLSIHFGEEYESQPNRKQRLIGESAIDFGADLIIGHHPHVLQPLEKYKHGWIAWSLGNFLFDQYFSEETMRGAVLSVEIKSGKIQSAEMILTRQNSAYQVELCPECEHPSSNYKLIDKIE